MGREPFRHATLRQRRAFVTDVNVPVRTGGVVVNPGDYVVGDATGIVVIPAARIEEVLVIAEVLSERDAQFAIALASESFSDIAKRLSPS